MAVPANTHETFQTIGLREDLSDLISRVENEKTPFTANIGSAEASSNTFHEWQTEALDAAVDDNAVPEGDDAGSQAANVRVRIGNYTQISEKLARVSGSNEKADAAGIGSEMDRQKLVRGLELKRDIDKQMLSNKASVAGSSGTARESAGMESWLTSNVSRGATGANGGFSAGIVAAPTDGTQRAFTESLLQTVQEAAFNNGGEPTALYLGSFNKRAFSGFSGIAQIRRDAPGTDQATIMGAADVYVGDFGNLAVIPTINIRSRTALLVDHGRIGKSAFRPMFAQELAKTGDSENWQLLEEYTLQVDNEQAHGVVADLTVS